MTDALLEACWTVGGTKAGYIADRAIYLSRPTISKVLRSMKGKSRRFETAFQIENLTEADANELIANHKAEGERLLGISKLPAAAFTPKKLRKLADAALHQSSIPNLPLLQCSRIIARDQTADTIKALITKHPGLAAEPGAFSEGMRMFPRRKMRPAKVPSLLESLLANPKLPDAEAGSMLDGFTPAAGDNFSKAGMRRIVTLRGVNSEIVDGLAMAILRNASTFGVNLDAVLSGLACANAFTLEHYETIRNSLQASSLPWRGLAAWSEAPAEDHFSLLSSDPESAGYILLNPALLPQVEERAAASFAPDAISFPLAALKELPRLSAASGSALADTIMTMTFGDDLVSLLSIPLLDSSVLEQQLSQSEFLRQKQGHRLSPLVELLASAPLDGPGVWNVLAQELRTSPTSDEAIAAVSHLECPEALVVEMLKLDCLGVAFAALINPNSSTVVRTMALKSLQLSKVEAAVISLLIDHVNSL